MRRVIDNDSLTMLFRLVVGVTFIYASLYKILQPADFAQSIWYYHMVPGSLINLMALILPWVELLAGLFLILGVLYRGSVVLMNLMTIMFIIALISAIVRGLDIDCGCFKVGGSGGSTVRSLLLDVGLLIMTLQLFFSRSKAFRLGSGR